MRKGQDSESQTAGVHREQGDMRTCFGIVARCVQGERVSLRAGGTAVLVAPATSHPGLNRAEQNSWIADVPTDLQGQSIIDSLIRERSFDEVSLRTHGQRWIHRHKEFLNPSIGNTVFIKGLPLIVSPFPYYWAGEAWATIIDRLPDPCRLLAHYLHQESGASCCLRSFAAH